MRRIISFKLAGNIVIILITLLIIFHVAVLLKLIPRDFVWSGRLDEDVSLFKYEILALGLSLLFLIIIFLKVKCLEPPGLRRLTYIAVWIIFAYFVFNVFGNLISTSGWEKIIFTPVSIFLAFFTLRLAIEK